MKYFADLILVTMYFYECRNKETSRHKPDGGCTLLWDDGSYCKYSKSATFLCFRSLPLQWTRPPQQPFSVEPHLCGVWPIFCKLALYVQKKKKKTNCVSVFQSAQLWGAKRAVFGHISSVKCKWRTSDIVSSFSPPCLSVAEPKSWLAIQAGATGSLCVYWEMRRVNNLPW